MPPACSQPRRGSSLLIYKVLDLLGLFYYCHYVANASKTPLISNSPALKPVHSSLAINTYSASAPWNTLEHCNKNATYQTNTPESSIAVPLW